MDLFVFTFHHDGALYRALSPLTPDEVHEDGLPSHAVLGQISALLPSMTPDQFEENDDFVALVHEVCQKLAPQLTDLQTAAKAQGTGQIYLIDQRAGQVTGDVSAEDILGVFDVRSGDILPKSYRANPQYRLLTDNGPIQLPGSLEEHLLQIIRTRKSESLS